MATQFKHSYMQRAQTRLESSLLSGLVDRAFSAQQLLIVCPAFCLFFISLWTEVFSWKLVPAFWAKDSSSLVSYREAGSPSNLYVS